MVEISKYTKIGERRDIQISDEQMTHWRTLVDTVCSSDIYSSDILQNMLQKLVTLLYVSGDPITISKIATILALSEDDVAKALPELETSLRTLGLMLLSSDEGLSIVTQPEYAPLVQSFWKEDTKGDLTPAALQVLTLVAYLGNPTREDISYIRGVQSSSSIRALSVRGLLRRNGEICTLTDESMKYLGITTAEELKEYKTIHKELSEKLQAKES
jgi:segregation and condensation protein B